MDNTVYLHLGYPKTGTTFLQQEYFTDIQNIYYVTQKKLWDSGFLDIILDDCIIDKQEKYNEILKSWKTEAGNKPLFVSYEGLMGNVLTGMQNFHLISDRLKATKFEFKILLTIRNQERIVDSLYLQYIHQGGALSFENFMRLPAKSPIRLSLNVFNYHLVYEKLQQTFGQGQVSVMPFEALKDYNDLNIYLSEYFELKIEIDKVDFQKRNVGLTGWPFHLLRFFNRFLSSWVSPNAIIPSKLINTTKVKNILQDLNYPKKKTAFFNKNNQCKAHIDVYKESNRILEEITGLELKAKYNYL